MFVFDKILSGEKKIAVVGLGYVGLPLAVALGRKVPVLGFDISARRVEMLKNGQDPSKELTASEMSGTQVEYTADASRLREASFLIVAVPTPIDEAKNPDLSAVLKACRTIGENLAKGSVVVFESTVYPGVTEELCGPELAKISGLKPDRDFRLGYSPERINPGDKEHTLTRVTKIVAGQDAETLELVAAVYSLVVEVGVYKASSIRVAEAAKVIENTQRDLNIALMNELSLIFDRMGIDTKDVLDAAGTKWNFLRFSPGLVGGHCIGVDPFYLTHKAKELGYNAEIILAGRRINDNMGAHVASKTIKLMFQHCNELKGARVLVMGLTFKENVSDIRNSRVIDVIRELSDFGMEVHVVDPFAEPEEVEHEYGLKLADWKTLPKVNAVVLATAHDPYRMLGPEELRALHSDGHAPILVDVKRALDRKRFESAGFIYWGL